MLNIRKHTQNVILDVISFICLILLLSTGVILYFTLPPGSKGDMFWGLTRHEWGEVHFWVAVVFTIAILLHLLLHMSWIKASLTKLRRNKSA